MTMIVIDKNKQLQTIFLTLTELTTISNPKYLLVMKCDATRNMYRFYLPVNSSLATERFDLFIIDTTAFDGMELGFYTYSIYQSNNTSNTDESTLGEAIDYGKMLIKEPLISANDYIIYDL